MRGTKTALLVGILALVAAPFAASADVILSVTTEDPLTVSASSTVTLDVWMTVDTGTATDNITWSIGCADVAIDDATVDCQFNTFQFNEAYQAGSGVVTWGNMKTAPPFFSGGGDSLNTSGSLPNAGDGLGIVSGAPVYSVEAVPVYLADDYTGSIGFNTVTQPLNGDDNAYLIGTITVMIQDVDVTVYPFFRSGEGAFNLAPSVPTQFEGLTFTVPEAGSGLLMAASMVSLAVIGRRCRRG